VRLAAVGDICLGDQVFCLGHGIHSRAAKIGYDRYFAHLRERTRHCDHVIGNLEGVVGDLREGEPPSFDNLMNRGPDEGADALKQAGFSLLSLANNHIFEHGPPGLEATVENLERVAVRHVGTCFAPLHLETLNGIRFAFLSWSLIPDVYCPELRASRYYNVTERPEDVVEAVRSARQSADRVVLSIHWGSEFVPQPSHRQRALAHRLIDAGASVILGHHPHVLQPMEIYGGGLIAYSLGNFVFDHWDRTCRMSAILEVEIGETVSYSIHPVSITRHFEPLPAKPPMDRTINRMLTDLRPLEEKDHRARAHAARRAYRRSAIAHLLGNLWRYDRGVLLPLLRWTVMRARFVMSLKGADKSDPSVVYKGPMKPGKVKSRQNDI